MTIFAGWRLGCPGVLSCLVLSCLLLADVMFPICKISLSQYFTTVVDLRFVDIIMFFFQVKSRRAPGMGVAKYILMWVRLEVMKFSNLQTLSLEYGSATLVLTGARMRCS